MSSIGPLHRTHLTDATGPGSAPALLPSRARRVALPAIELALLAAWTLWVGRDYLDLRETLWPLGRELGHHLVGNHMWIRLRECGSCALWDGGANGGYPVAVDVFTSALHPLVGLTTLVWGVVGGLKVTLLASLFTAALAQWWMARLLGLGATARLWSGALVVVGGHLGAKMEGGMTGLVISGAFTSLALAALLAVGIRPRRRYGVVLGVAVGWALLSGQGYLQAGMALAAPAALVFFSRRRAVNVALIREWGRAALIAALIAAPLLVPMASFQGEFEKDRDPQFGASQALEYLPLNLVIRDDGYLHSDRLGKYPYLWMYSSFVGWLPVLLLFAAARYARGDAARPLTFLALWAGLALFLASAAPLRWLVPLAERVTMLRNVVLVSAIAVPAILGIAAFGLDALMRRRWPGFTVGGARRRGPRIDLHLALYPLLVWSLVLPYRFVRPFLTTSDATRLYAAMPSLSPGDSSQWVQPPYGEHFWVEAALHEKLKLTKFVHNWSWKDRPTPDPHRIAARQPEGRTPIAQLEPGIAVYAGPGEYAYVETAGQRSPCRAQSLGGRIDVTCDVPSGGRLVVEENHAAGWRAAVDGQPAALEGERWLSLQLPPGARTVALRYLPWDGVTGWALAMVGAALALVWMLRRGD